MEKGFRCLDINVLVGKILVDVKVSEGDSEGDGEHITFTTNEGEVYVMYHDQDCCEGVYIDDVCGDLDDLIGLPIVRATEDTNVDENPEGVEKPTYQGDSFTWTFYNIATAKGHVTIRWYGESNGYYSESVNLHRTK